MFREYGGFGFGARWGYRDLAFRVWAGRGLGFGHRVPLKGSI